MKAKLKVEIGEFFDGRLHALSTKLKPMQTFLPATPGGKN